MVNFAEILNTKADTIKKPEALPAGNYKVFVQSFEEGRVSSKGNPSLKIVMKVLEPISVADEEALSKIENLSERKVTHTMYLTEDSLWRLKEFLENAGINIEGRNLGDCVQDLVNAEIGVQLEQRVDGDNTYIDVKNTFNPNA